MNIHVILEYHKSTSFALKNIEACRTIKTFKLTNLKTKLNFLIKNFILYINNVGIIH